MTHAKRLLLILALLILLALGVWFFALPAREHGPREAADYRNGTYEIDGRWITLEGGVAEEELAPGSAAKRVTRVFGNDASGDVSGDGAPDIVFLLDQDGSGSGLFYYAVAAIRTPGGYRGTNAVLLGDRIAPQPTEIRDGVAIVNYAERSPEEPMTARPSLGISRRLIVRDGVLREAQ